MHLAEVNEDLSFISFNYMNDYKNYLKVYADTLKKITCCKP